VDWTWSKNGNHVIPFIYANEKALPNFKDMTFTLLEGVKHAKF
jgi:hypothetical protein